METQNDNCKETLEDLLSKWKLDIILCHLQDEKVDTDILKMMKMSHIKELLYNFPLGIQIRFEYNLEQWRKQIGRPLQVIPTNEVKYQYQKMETLHKADILDEEVEIEEDQTEDSKSMSNCSPSARTTNQNDPIDVDKGNHDTNPQTINENDKDINDLSFGRQEKFMKSLIQAPPVNVDLRYILSQTKNGLTLMKNLMKCRRRFTESERKLLIKHIVNYFLDHNIDISLQISYGIERAILKMFPFERLDFYRKSKRGRIYSKHIRNKADRRRNQEFEMKIKKRLKTMSAGNGSCDNSKVAHIQDHTLPASVGADETQFESYYDTNNSNASMDMFIYELEDTVDNIEIKIEPEEIKEPNDEPVKINNTTTSPSKNNEIKRIKSRNNELSIIPFENFKIPWDRVPFELNEFFENQQPLGKNVNVFANFVVGELRQISKHVPMHVLRAVTDEAILKYPNCFLDKDSKGNLIPSTNAQLLTRMRYRNCNLNRGWVRKDL